MVKALRQPANPADVAKHKAVQIALKKLRYRALHARRWHAHAVRAIDAVYSELPAELAEAPLNRRVDVIAKFERELETYLRVPAEEESP
jgi:hypothetical protein